MVNNNNNNILMITIKTRRMRNNKIIWNSHLFFTTLNIVYYAPLTKLERGNALKIKTYLPANVHPFPSLHQCFNLTYFIQKCNWVMSGHILSREILHFEMALMTLTFLSRLFELHFYTMYCRNWVGIEYY